MPKENDEMELGLKVKPKEPEERSQAEPGYQFINYGLKWLLGGLFIGSVLVTVLNVTKVTDLKQHHANEMKSLSKTHTESISRINESAKQYKLNLLKAQEHYTSVPKEALVYICAVPSFDEVVIRKNRIMCEQKNGNILMASSEKTEHDMDDGGIE